jgi:hypothetical protein
VGAAEARVRDSGRLEEPNKAKAPAFVEEILSKAGQAVLKKDGCLPLTSASGASQ